MPIPLPGGC